MKKLIVFTVVMLCVIIVVSAVADVAAKRFIPNWLNNNSEAIWVIEDVRIHIVKGAIGLKEIKISNPPQFSDELMADIPELYVDFSLSALAKGEVQFDRIVINLKELNLIRNKANKVNVDMLKVTQAIKKDTEKARKSKMHGFRIALLDLKIGKIVYRDFRGEGQPSVTEYDLNMSGRYKNITNPRAFIAKLAAQSLAKSPLENMMNLDFNSVTKEANKVFDKTTSAVRKTAEKTGETIREILPILEAE